MMSSHKETRPGGKSGLALLVMDGTIVTVGLPVIGSGLNIAATDLDWVLTSYALARATDRPCRGARHTPVNRPGGTVEAEQSSPRRPEIHRDHRSHPPFATRH